MRGSPASPIADRDADPEVDPEVVDPAVNPAVDRDGLDGDIGPGIGRGFQHVPGTDVGPSGVGASGVGIGAGRGCFLGGPVCFGSGPSVDLGSDFDHGFDACLDIEIADPDPSEAAVAEICRLAGCSIDEYEAFGVQSVHDLGLDRDVCQHIGPPRVPDLIDAAPRVAYRDPDLRRQDDVCYQHGTWATFPI